MTDVLEASLTVTEVDVVDSAGPLLAVIGDGERNRGGRGGGGALKSMSNIALGDGGSVDPLWSGYALFKTGGTMRSYSANEMSTQQGGEVDDRERVGLYNAPALAPEMGARTAAGVDGHLFACSRECQGRRGG